MDTNTDPFIVAAMGDLHMSEDWPEEDRPGPLLIDMIAEISDQANALALCGDLTNLGTVREAEMLAEVLALCQVPIMAVLGNHDHESGQVEEVTRILCQAGVCMLGQHPHVVRGVGFAGVKGFAGGFAKRMLGGFGEPAIKQFVAETEKEAQMLERQLRSLVTDKTVVVLHYAPVSSTVQGEPPEIFPFLGSSRLAEVIDHFDVDAVVHGHAHHGSFRGQTPRGIPVFNVAQPVEKEGSRPYALIRV